MEQTLEDSIKQYTESLQYRITELLTGVDKSKIDKVILDRLSQQELISYTDKVVKDALGSALKEMTKEVQKLMTHHLRNIISEDMIRKTLLEAEVAEMMTKVLCKRVASSIEEGYY